MYKENNRKYIFTLPYSPESNGYIKNFNKQLRKMFREIFIRKNNLKWVDYLQICCDNNNTQYNRTTKHTPNTLWHPDLFYNNIQIKISKMHESMSSDILPQEIRMQARNNVKE